MRTTSVQRMLMAALLALNASCGFAHGQSRIAPYVQPGLVQVDVYDRADATALPVYMKNGRRYIVGTPGHEYAVRIRNRTPARVVVVTSVDGVNVISGDTAAPSQSGYVLEAWGSVEIVGWRKSLERTAAFYFTEHQNSYAARTGRPDNVGVIGVAVFRERMRPITRPYAERPDLRREPGPSESETPAPGGRLRGLDSDASAPAAAAREAGAADELARYESQDRPAMQGKLGTGHGRGEASRVSVVDFERATSTPAETVAIQYDRRENLVALGVLPARTPRFAGREPDPFPDTMRFVPDPGR